VTDFNISKEVALLSAPKFRIPPLAKGDKGDLNRSISLHDRAAHFAPQPDFYEAAKFGVMENTPRWLMKSSDGKRNQAMP
jgi:hypothetical protein